MAELTAPDPLRAADGFGGWSQRWKELAIGVPGTRVKACSGEI
jgi:hypothetical protein